MASAGQRIIVLDVGSTSAKASAYSTQAQVVASRTAELQQLHPEPLQTEYDPELMWRTVRDLLADILTEVPVSSVSALSMTVMRNSVMVWHRASGRPLTRIISWQDRRAGQVAVDLNNSLRVRAFRAACRLLHWLSGSAKFLAASVLYFKIGMAVLQVIKYFADNPQQLQLAKSGEICVGCVESWLLWKLTSGRVFATDSSCASITGMYDSFAQEWSSIVAGGLLGLPLRMLPEVLPTAGHFGHTDAGLFGAELPIASISGDQSAATFGELCHSAGQVKVTLGTGTFLDWNTGASAYASMLGLYPVIGWQLANGGTTYLIEGSHSDTGNTIDWGCRLGLYECAAEAEAQAQRVPDCGGVAFVPCFTWSTIPVFDPGACGGFLGITGSTTRQHMARAILEAVIFQTKAIADAFYKETGLRPSMLRCNGGVSGSKFVLQGIADLLNCEVVRAANQEATSMGAAFFAGIGTGVWTQEQLLNFNQVVETFNPRPAVGESLLLQYRRWQLAVSRCYSWW